MIKKSLMSAALAASMFALSAPASATLSNWYLDADAGGSGAGVVVKNYVDLNGQAYVDNTFTSATNFTFKEAGSFISLVADSNLSKQLSPSLTSTFTGTGSGTVGATGGTLTFDSGTLSVFSGSTLIATFDLLTGSANLGANSTLPNGAVSLIFKATYMLAGYFFTDSTKTTDLATLVASPEGLVMGFATTNALPLALDEVNDPDALAAIYNAKFGGTGITVGAEDLFISNNGQIRLSVPEPSTLSLFGLALVGFGFTARRKSKV
ncbi:flocculation-associated PEP-CTERM protein PepA [Rhodoferax sp.]|uniref:flocculation-associated PEP-CTERM protein PepA n=1 Tax=Rhodoferax sp. TaxID=50421 RepID=UPI00374C8F89